jgi:hypothetical protein
VEPDAPPNSVERNANEEEEEDGFLAETCDTEDIEIF